MKNSFIPWIIAGLALLFLLQYYLSGIPSNMQKEKWTYSQLIVGVKSNKIEEAQLKGERLSGVTRDGKLFETVLPANHNIADVLASNSVDVTILPLDRDNILINMLMSVLPILLIFGIIFFMMRSVQGQGSKALGFGKSKAKLLNEVKDKVTFKDVAGIEEAKEEVSEIVEFLKDSMKFKRLGGKIPKGILLVGSPGTGKTLLARAIAGEADVPFFSISGSDFVEMFVGVGASRVRDMFVQAKKNSPCIIFIDEIDAVGRSRGAGLGGGNDEREQTLNQLLVEMDGFESNEGIILVAATNRPDVLDPALLRPGRFDRQVVVPNPDVNGRKMIIDVHTKNVPLAANVDKSVLARGTPGFSGADLANLINEAALLAAKRNKRVVTMQEFEDAKDKVLMGAERRSMVMTQKERELTAYHEAGHAVVALNVPGTDPVHKATIIPRGRALGMVMQLPERDKLSMSLQEMLSRLAILMGGRVAEEIKFGQLNVTSGASSDIEQATKLARAMVTQYGLSEKLGPISYAEDDGEVFLGQSIARSKSVSGETTKLIESEIKQIIMDAHVKATTILTTKKSQWERLAKGLLKYETLTGDEIDQVVKGKKLNREEVTAAADMPFPTVPSVSKDGKLQEAKIAINSDDKKKLVKKTVKKVKDTLKTSQKMSVNPI